MSDNIQTRIEKGAQDVHNYNANADQFAVAQVPFHTHNDSDSPKLYFSNLLDRFEFINEVLPGTSAATAGNYGVIFIAPYPCTFIGATEVHAVLGTDGSAVTLQIEKLTGTTASGSGTSLLATGFNLKGTINTVQTAQLAAITRPSFNLVKGDRLGLKLTGTPTSVSQVCVIIQLSY